MGTDGFAYLMCAFSDCDDQIINYAKEVSISDKLDVPNTN